MALSELEFLTGLFSLIVSVISIYVGLHIALQYRKYESISLLFVGISWIGLTNGWWPSAISFLLSIFTGNSLEPIPYFIIGNVFVPWWLFLWMIAMNDFLSIKRKQLVLLIFALFAFLFDFLLFYYISVDITRIGVLQGALDVQYSGLISLLLVVVLIAVLLNGLLFAREALKADKPETKLKGKLIGIAFISYSIGAIADASISLDFVSLVVIRLLLISSSIEFYLRMLMPEKIKNRFLKRE